MSKITLALHGEGTLTIVENAEADRLTRMGYCTYQDRSTHAMGNLNAYTLSVCLHNYFNSPEFPDSSICFFVTLIHEGDMVYIIGSVV